MTEFDLEFIYESYKMSGLGEKHITVIAERLRRVANIDLTDSQFQEAFELLKKRNKVYTDEKGNWNLHPYVTCSGILLKTEIVH